MKRKRHFFWRIVLAALGFLAGVAVVRANFTTTPNGTSGYFINGTNNATLTLSRGVTYVFSVSAAGHPFFIMTNLTTDTSHQFTNGVTGNGVQNGTLTFVVPANAPNTLFYHCSVHPTMGGTLNIASAPPPNVKVVFISVDQDVVTVKSTGSASWTAIPEFNSNLTASSWASVPNFTNTFANGTNTTVFNRLDPICGPNVYLRVRNQSQ